MCKCHVKRTGASKGPFKHAQIYEALYIGMRDGRKRYEVAVEGRTVVVYAGSFFEEVGPQEWFQQEYLIQPEYDVHKENAAKLFNVPINAVTADQRAEAKRRAFRTNYSGEPMFGGQSLRDQIAAMQSVLACEVKLSPAALAAIKSIPEEIMNPSIPHAPYQQSPAPYGVPKTAEQIVQDAQQALADAEAALAAQIERDAFREELDNQIKNVQLVALLLNDIRNDAVVGIKTGPRMQYAEHRKMLNEYAEEHGYKLVLVGDKTEAMLVQA